MDGATKAVHLEKKLARRVSVQEKLELSRVSSGMQPAMPSMTALREKEWGRMC